MAHDSNLAVSYGDGGSLYDDGMNGVRRQAYGPGSDPGILLPVVVGCGYDCGESRAASAASGLCELRSSHHRKSDAAVGEFIYRLGPSSEAGRLLRRPHRKTGRAGSLTRR